MTSATERLQIHQGEETEALINFIFRELPDDVVDNVGLERLPPSSSGVARELVTTGAILTFSSAVAIKIFALIQRWMEVKRQTAAMQLIYEAGRENPDVLKVLAHLEKHHASIAVKYLPIK